MIAENMKTISDIANDIIVSDKFVCDNYKTKLIESTKQLQFDIDDCITKLTKSRLDKNHEEECVALLRMESLLCAMMQQLQCHIDYLEQIKT